MAEPQAQSLLSRRLELQKTINALELAKADLETQIARAEESPNTFICG